MIIKEWASDNGDCSIRSDHYGHSFSYIHSLYRIAKKDKPDLKPSDVRVVKHAGQSFAKTMGIRFRSEDAPTDEYEIIHQLELTI